jgi:Domain of unknown function (DUF4276)
MRDCIFLVADSHMEAAFNGFLTRQQFHLSLGTGVFEFDPNQDMIQATGKNDPGVYGSAHQYLSFYQKSHRYAVIALDKQWDGSPGVEKIEQTIAHNMQISGWETDRFVVIVIDPELESWILQDSSMLIQLFKLDVGGDTSPKSWLVKQNAWEVAEPKATDPKTALEKLLKQSTAQKISISAANYKKITSAITVRHCIDPAFHKLKSTLQTWFPPTAAGGTP